MFPKMVCGIFFFPQKLSWICQKILNHPHRDNWISTLLSCQQNGKNLIEMDWYDLIKSPRVWTSSIWLSRNRFRRVAVWETNSLIYSSEINCSAWIMKDFFARHFRKKCSSVDWVCNGLFAISTNQTRHFHSDRLIEAMRCTLFWCSRQSRQTIVSYWAAGYYFGHEKAQH